MTLNVNFDEVFEHVMMNAIIAACDGNGVLDGLTVSENGAGADMSVDVAAGNCMISGTKYTESSVTNLAISAADATYDRKDLVVYDSSTGDPAVVTGTAAATPIPPDIPLGDILLAIVDVAAGVTQILDIDITDCIVLLQNPYDSVVTKVFADSPYTTTPTDDTILCDATSGSITINLLTAVGISGKKYNIKKIDSTSNSVTIDPDGAETIDGETSITITGENDNYTIQSDGTNWRII